MFELHGVPVTLEHEGFYVHDTATGRPRLVHYVDWTRDLILRDFADSNALLAQWAEGDGRARVVDILRRGRVDPARLLAELAAENPDRIDTVDALLHVAFNQPMLTRAERARRASSAHQAELDAMPAKARHILGLLIQRYAESGVDESASPQVVNVPPLADVGSPAEIAAAFGGARHWHAARDQLHQWLYST